MKAITVWILAYVYGSVPFVDVLARMRSVDLKDVGSGNVGATNLLSVGGPVLAIAGWLADASKGLLPVLVGRQLGLSASSAGIAGVCGTAGQCWPMTLGFSGGRGISAFIGASCAMDRASWVITLVPFIAGSVWRVTAVLSRGDHRRSRSVPLGSLVGVLTFPVAMWALGRGPLLPTLLLPAIILVRRLTAPLPDDVVEGPAEESHAVVYRLLYDRNTAA